MQSFYRWHWIPDHRGYSIPGLIDNERDLFSRTPCDIIKIVTVDERIPYLEDIPSGARIHVRYHKLTENEIGPAEDQGRVLHNELHARQVADNHHASIMRIVAWAEANGIPRSRLSFATLNEPQFPQGGGREPYNLLVVYWLRLLDLNQAQHVNSVVGEFGAGWPPDKGYPDAPVDFDTFRPVYEKLGPGDRWSIHLYWGSYGVDFWWAWLAGRSTQRPAWMHGKKYWITETGSDFVPNTNKDGVAYVSSSRGWLTYPGTEQARAVRFMGELGRFEQRIRSEDHDAEYAFVFSLDGNADDWSRFQMLNPEILRLYIPYVQAAHDFGGGEIIVTPIQLPERIAKWQSIVVPTAAHYGLDPRIVNTVMELESAGNPNAESHDAAGNVVATGLMQVVSREAMERITGNHSDRPTRAQLLDPATCVNWGCSILNDGIKASGGDLAWGLCHYYGASGGPGSADGIKYINAFQAAWGRLYSEPCPVGVAVVTPPPPVEIPASVADAIRKAAWDVTGIHWNADGALFKAAKAQDMGRPVTNEFDLSVNGQDYRAQGYEDGILFAVVGQWDAIKVAEWL